jgi:hypothetical protein
MVNTKKNQVFLEKSASWKIAPHDDVYTVRDGHFVGHDGFIVPNNFREFYQRFPTYVTDWMRRRVRDCASATEAEDWTQELLLHLAALPTRSKFRRDGMQDVIQTFAPERMHGANEARFRSFINQCLSNKFNTLYVKWRKRPLSNPRNLPFEVDAEHGASDEFCHSNSEYLRQAGCRRQDQDERRLRIDEFVRLGTARLPGLQLAIETFRRTGEWEQAATSLGVGRKQCDSLRWRIRELGKALA